MDKLTKKEIARLTNESIASVRLALGAAVQAGVEARAMAEYVKAIDHLEDVACYFGDDDDDTDSKPDSPEPDDDSKEFERFRSAVSAQFPGVHVGLGLIRR